MESSGGQRQKRMDYSARRRLRTVPTYQTTRRHQRDYLDMSLRCQQQLNLITYKIYTKESRSCNVFLQVFSIVILALSICLPFFFPLPDFSQLQIVFFYAPLIGGQDFSNSNLICNCTCRGQDWTLNVGVRALNVTINSPLCVDKKNQLDVTLVFFISLLIVAQHVSGNHVPIIRS